VLQPFPNPGKGSQNFSRLSQVWETSLGIAGGFTKKRNAADGKGAAITPETILPSLKNDLMGLYFNYLKKIRLQNRWK